MMLKIALLALAAVHVAMATQIVITTYPTGYGPLQNNYRISDADYKKWLLFSVSTDLPDKDGTGADISVELDIVPATAAGQVVGSALPIMFSSTALLRTNKIAYPLPDTTLPGTYVIRARSTATGNIPAVTAVSSSVNFVVYAANCVSSKFSIPTDVTGVPTTSTRAGAVCSSRVADITCADDGTEVATLLNLCLSGVNSAWVNSHYSISNISSAPSSLSFSSTRVLGTNLPSSNILPDDHSRKSSNLEPSAERFQCALPGFEVNANKHQSYLCRSSLSSLRNALLHPFANLISAMHYKLALEAAFVWFLMVGVWAAPFEMKYEPRAAAVSVWYSQVGYGPMGDTFRIAPTDSNKVNVTSDPRYLLFTIDTNLPDVNPSTGQPNTFDITIVGVNNGASLKVFPSPQPNSLIRAKSIGLYFPYGTVPGDYYIQVVSSSGASARTARTFRVVTFNPACWSTNFNIPTDYNGNPISSAKSQAPCDNNLADILTQADNTEATNLLYSCIGDGGRAWINSHNPDGRYSSACSPPCDVSISVDATSQTYTTFTSPAGQLSLPAICR
ncbi:uncharacterized protein BJ171DRAFT_579866 [Polychytrium aggregatum]|uniref:uncharacterized protein n=1 Tax=Polychytrium aggregatum TaxID=110093 RepID=UPI0022FDE877|nr:uncharacterized protein BJ171DRAFT_579866 [Polychytrium aggregatum]KAI9206362.1 hypothetical protein BJ171DRAFT_579866 [Polychytrium aggregatum]